MDSAPKIRREITDTVLSLRDYPGKQQNWCEETKEDVQTLGKILWCKNKDDLKIEDNLKNDEDLKHEDDL